MVTEGNFGQETDLDDLPNQAKHQVRPSFDQILGANVDDVTANGFGRVDDDVVVFCLVEGVLGVEVQGTLIDGVSDGFVDQFTSRRCQGKPGCLGDRHGILPEQDTILTFPVQLHAFPVDREARLEMWIVLEGIIDVIRELLLFVFVDGMLRGVRGATDTNDLSRSAEDLADGIRLDVSVVGNELCTEGGEGLGLAVGTCARAWMSWR